MEWDQVWGGWRERGQGETTEMEVIWQVRWKPSAVETPRKLQGGLFGISNAFLEEVDL